MLKWRIWISLVLLALLLSGLGVAQSDNPYDYSVLTGRKAFLRWDWAYRQRAFPKDVIPYGSSARALEQIRREGLSTQQSTGLWTSLGPSPIGIGQIGSTLQNRPVSGRVADIVVDPTDNSHWYIGGASGGVWETTNAGTSWTPLSNSEATQTIGALAIAASNTDILFAGTGEGVNTFAGEGLLKSVNGGQSWQLLGTEAFAGLSFTDIQIDPANPNLLVVATLFGFAGRLFTAFPPNAPQPGILRSSDGGSSWTNILDGEASDLEVNPDDFNEQYAALGSPFTDPANGLYRSTNAGASFSPVGGPWNSVAGGVGRIELAIAPSDPDVMYVSVMDVFDGSANDGGLLGLWKTSNAWDAVPSWAELDLADTDDGSGNFGYCGWDNAFASASRQCWYDHDLIVDPTNADILYAGGIPLWKRSSTGVWTEVSQTKDNPAGGIHVDHHALAWAGTRLIAGNDGGVWSSPDGGATWAEHNSGLTLTQHYHGSIHPTDNGLLIAGNQDNGTSLRTNSNIWTLIGGGDGADNTIANDNPNTHWAYSSQELTIFRTKDGAITDFIIASGGIDDTNAPFIARLEKCPSDDDIFIAGTDNLWRSNNFFATTAPTQPSWFSNSPELGTGVNNAPIQISALAFAPTDTTCDTYAFGTNQGQLRLTSTAGLSWTDIDLSNQVPGRFVTEVVFDPSDANKLYVALSGFEENTPGQPGHLYMTSNALAANPSWTNISTPVNLPHNTFAIDPANSDILYTGTDLGVWRSSNSGSTWTQLGPATGMPNVPVYDLQFNRDGSRLIAFTHGRGSFALDSASSTEADLALSLSASPNPAAVAAELSLVHTISNSGPSQAVSVFLGSQLPANSSFVSLSSSQGSCTGSSTFSCNLGALELGSTATVTLVIMPTAAGTLSYQADVSTLSTDPDSSDNSRSIQVTINAAGTPSLTVAKGSQSPTNTTKASAGDTAIPMLQLALTAAAEAIEIEGLVLKASGTGKDQLDISRVKLIADANNNGRADSGETLIAQGSYSSDNGTLSLTPTNPQTISSTANWLITYDLASSLASLYLIFGLAPLLLLGLARLSPRRFGLLSVITLVLLLNACPATSSKNVASFGIQVQTITAKGSVTATAATVSGLPVSGTTLSVDKP